MELADRAQGAPRRPGSRGGRRRRRRHAAASSRPSRRARAPGLPARATTPGIDVSYHQETIDWPRVQRAGIRFAFIRLSDGAALRDAMFATNWAEAKRAGLVRGAYQFFRPDQSIAEQADLMIAAMRDRDHDDLPPVIDIEVDGGFEPPTVAERARAWIERVRDRLGVEPIVYTGSDLWRNGGAEPLAAQALWIALHARLPGAAGAVDALGVLAAHRPRRRPPASRARSISICSPARSASSTRRVSASREPPNPRGAFVADRAVRVWLARAAIRPPPPTRSVRGRRQSAISDDVDRAYNLGVCGRLDEMCGSCTRSQRCGSWRSPLPCVRTMPGRARSRRSTPGPGVHGSRRSAQPGDLEHRPGQERVALARDRRRRLSVRR